MRIALVGVVLIVAAGCGTAPQPQGSCGPSNCQGCCAGTTCVAPDEMNNSYCGGYSGGSCGSCTAGSTCTAGTGGSRCFEPCGARTCAGCCLSADICQSGLSSAACGKGGATCAACSAGQTCSASGVCQVPPPPTIAVTINNDTGETIFSVTATPQGTTQTTTLFNNRVAGYTEVTGPRVAVPSGVTFDFVVRATHLGTLHRYNFSNDPADTANLYLTFDFDVALGEYRLRYRWQ